MVDKNTYVGPYIRATVEIDENGLEKGPDYWDFSEPLRDNLYSTSIMSPPKIVNNKRIYILLPNHSYAKIGIPGPLDLIDEISIDDMNINEIKRKFEEVFEVEIEYIKKFFEIEVKFGFIYYET